MKLTLTILFILTFNIITYSQVKKFHIKGVVENVGENQFAILYVFDTADNPIIFKEPIINNQFVVEGEISYNGLLYKAGAVFLRKDTLNIDANSYELGMHRRLVIDSLNIYIEDNEKLKLAKVEGKLLNKEFDELNETASTGEYLKYFNSHKDSVFSITLMSSLIRIDHMIGIGINEYKRIFLTFSNRIKESIEGKKLEKKLFF